MGAAAAAGKPRFAGATDVIKCSRHEDENGELRPPGGLADPAHNLAAGIGIYETV